MALQNTPDDQHKMQEQSYPKFLIKTFIIFSIVSTAIIFFLINYGMYRIFQKYSVSEAEHSAVSISNALFEQEKDSLLHTAPDGSLALSVEKEYFAELDRRMKKYLITFDIVKIKTFAPNGEIIYSTDHKIIGQISKDNENLQKALSGGIFSKLEKKDKVTDIEGEDRFDVDVVETYVPIRTDDNRIIGSFEIYLDITRYRNSVKAFVQSTLIITLIIMAVILGFLFVLMLHGAKQLRKAHEHMQELASVDGLTGLVNRRFLLLRAEEEFSRVQRFGKDKSAEITLGAIMLDIDHFKMVNDSFGHLAGDEILKQLAQRIRESVRKYEIVGRYGGEEFLVISTQADPATVQHMAYRIWNTVREKPFVVEGEPHNITVSIGVSCFSPDDKNIENIIKRADEALYLSKAGGRDRLTSI